MRTNGELAALLQKKCYNEHDYYDKVAVPFLSLLGVPEINRYAQFTIRTFLGDQKTDYLVFLDNIPILAVEAKYQTKDFDSAIQQVKFFCTNFDPIPKGIRKQTVPFQLVLAGNKAQQFRIKIQTDGLTPDVAPVTGFLEWEDLHREAEPFRELPTIVERGQFVSPLIKEVVAPEVIYSEQASQFLEDLYNTFEGISTLKNKDEKVLCLNKILLTVLSGRLLTPVFDEYDFGNRIRKKVDQILKIYDFTKLPKPTVAYAYRQFVSRNFTGESFGLKARIDGKLKNVGRYLTPIEVIKFMVNLVEINPTDKVIDFACGSGGFLGETLSEVQEKDGDVERFIKNNLFGCDIDRFSVSTSKTFLALLYPDLQGQFKIFQLNGLYSEDIRKSRTDEEKGVAEFIKNNLFDLVISNPPGNKEYSGTNAKYVKQKFNIESFFWDTVPFLKRAIELVKPEGKICVVLPDGFCANEQLQFLRDEVLKECQVKAIISLPRIFKFNNASFHIVYMVKSKKKDKETFMASIPLKVFGEDGIEEPVNINSELQNILNEFKNLQ